MGEEKELSDNYTGKIETGNINGYSEGRINVNGRKSDIN